ncbi:transmembrane protein 267 [Anopheles cruzii]|uniref:transmembrane protein 267 n=1 Tax=Anopheles cruzii TaxID=68878 RepID=UPI0022EC3F59|nr:transmembrane protein 267 [Anopheles cruzii]XP_052861945.1 transmembrane protein 267 [Anopheles cruzii]
MFLNISLFLKHVGLCFVCILADKLSEAPQMPALLRACIDNATHALIGLIGAELVLGSVKYHPTKQEYGALLLEAALVSSLIDLDHFVEARSFRLQDATNLDRRPFLHNSAICFLPVMLLFVGKRTTNGVFTLAIAIVLIAFSTHHVRDATRRGIWFKVPFVDLNSPPIPYFGYLAFVNGAPYAISLLLSSLVKVSAKSRVAEMV